MFLPTHVFHLAATTGIGQLPLDHFKTNINGVQNIVNVLTIVGSVKRVIFASSLLVCKVGYIPDSYDEYLPSTSYGISKMKGEIIVKSSASDLDWVIVRPISIWGPWNSEPYLQFFQSVLRGYYFNIGNLSSLRSLGYVENTVYQLACLALAPAQSVCSKTFYLADYEPTPLKTMALLISRFRSFPDFIPTLPFFVVRVLAYIGDILVHCFRFSFPLTSFRLHNLSTEYVLTFLPYPKCVVLAIHFGSGWTISFLRNCKC